VLEEDKGPTFAELRDGLEALLLNDAQVSFDT
jgi:hypothetical protein